jgi:hypothetical protein
MQFQLQRIDCCVCSAGLDHKTLQPVTKAIPVSIEGAVRVAAVEKNWAPFVMGDTLHFIYTLDPLVVLSCKHVFTRGQCSILFAQDNVEVAVDTRTDFLRQVLHTLSAHLVCTPCPHSLSAPSPCLLSTPPLAHCP